MHIHFSHSAVDISLSDSYFHTMLHGLLNLRCLEWVLQSHSETRALCIHVQRTDGQNYGQQHSFHKPEPRRSLQPMYDGATVNHSKLISQHSISNDSLSDNVSGA